MSSSNAVCHALTTFVALAMLGGCSGGSSSQIAPPLAQVPAVGTQPAQRQALQGGGLNGILARHGGTLTGHSVTSPSYMDPNAVGKPLLFFMGGVDPLSWRSNIWTSRGLIHSPLEGVG